MLVLHLWQEIAKSKNYVIVNFALCPLFLPKLFQQVLIVPKQSTDLGIDLVLLMRVLCRSLNISEIV